MCLAKGNNSMLEATKVMGKNRVDEPRHLWFLKRSDTNRVVQAQKMARGWKFWLYRGIVLSL